MSDAVALRDDPSSRLTEAFRAVAVRMRGLDFVNPALEVEAVGFAPWENCWLGVMLTPWFMSLALLPRDPVRWQPLAVGEKRRYRFPAGVYEFIGAADAVAGDYQMCSLFSPVLEFDDQATARLVAELAREALFDPQNAESHDYPEANLAPAAAAAPGPPAGMQARVEAPMSKRDFLRGRVLGPGRESPG